VNLVFNPDVDDSLQAYQVATGNHFEDQDVKDCVMWMKYDFMKLGKLRRAHAALDCRLRDLNGNIVNLSEFYSDFNKPLVLVAGSSS